MIFRYYYLFYFLYMCAFVRVRFCVRSCICLCICFAHFFGKRRETRRGLIFISEELHAFLFAIGKVTNEEALRNENAWGHIYVCAFARLCGWYIRRL
jgi:hypothetical protein